MCQNVLVDAVDGGGVDIAGVCEGRKEERERGERKEGKG